MIEIEKKDNGKYLLTMGFGFSFEYELEGLIELYNALGKFLHDETVHTERETK